MEMRFLSFGSRGLGFFDPDAPKWGRVTYILFVVLLYDSFEGFILALFPVTQAVLPFYYF